MKNEGEVHVVIFPVPAQGHVNSMLQLAELLVVWGIEVSFVNTEHIHHRLLRFSDIESRLSAYSNLHFLTIPDGLPPDHPRHGHDIGLMFKQINLVAEPLLTNICLQNPNITCIIGDGIFGRLTNQLGRKLRIPVIHFRTVSACSFWAYFCVPTLFHSHQLPLTSEDEDMDRIITQIPGMENLIRCRDLPSFCRQSHNGEITEVLELVVSETHQTLRAQALILNTFEDLEGPVLSQIRLRFPNLYTLGPLHAHLASKTASSTPTTTSLWQVDTSCITWLDAQPPKSVIYVSFGSVTTMSRDEVMEIWYGLVNSNKRFLWVIRPGMVAPTDGKENPSELVEGTKERGCMVEWAPQKEVLLHVAVGGFMTHSGWNSTLESIAAGVPMICWPYFADQQTNSRFVSEVWKVGLDMKDVCDRKVVENMVNDLMVERKDEFLKNAHAMAALAKASVTQGGSSYSHFHTFLHYLKSIAIGHAK